MIDFKKITKEELDALLPYAGLSKRGVARRIVHFFRTNGTADLPEYRKLCDDAFEYLCESADDELSAEERELYKSIVGKYDGAPIFTKKDIELFL